MRDCVRQYAINSYSSYEKRDSRKHRQEYGGQSRLGGGRRSDFFQRLNFVNRKVRVETVELPTDCIHELLRFRTCTNDQSHRTEVGPQPERLLCVEEVQFRLCRFTRTLVLNVAHNSNNCKPRSV